MRRQKRAGPHATNASLQPCRQKRRTAPHKAVPGPRHDSEVENVREQCIEQIRLCVDPAEVESKLKSSGGDGRRGTGHRHGDLSVNLMNHKRVCHRLVMGFTIGVIGRHRRDPGNNVTNGGM
jgi:hypothetical protein